MSSMLDALVGKSQRERENKSFDALLCVAEGNLIRSGKDPNEVHKARNMVWVGRHRSIDDVACGVWSNITNDLARELIAEVFKASKGLEQ